ncbi:HupE/UreJ family protein [Spongiimicrobium sp. 3-5]|uniref:HupE/UreJ family protein n=1 Tax=Spongiimicrobium sp. 3-5 TaxID=3332596 RepID=UPI00397EB5B2
MEEFWFYVQLGLRHVLDINAYDHILFLAALAIPFTIRSWKKVVLLATAFTIAHCLSLALSVYGIATVDAGLIEFFIPVTILLTALFNLFYVNQTTGPKKIWVHLLATLFFGIVHGFGFSNYFKMLMAEEEQKLGPLLGFATGIEISQVTVIACVLALGLVVQSVFKVPQRWFTLVGSIIILVITIPMLIKTFPL